MVTGSDNMNNKVLQILIIMFLMFIYSGCGAKSPKATLPSDNAPKPPTTTSTDSDKPSMVSIGPPVQEIYDPNQSQQNSEMVYVTAEAGVNYHRLSCKYLNNGKIALGLDEAKEEGYTPCPVCKPPQ